MFLHKSFLFSPLFLLFHLCGTITGLSLENMSTPVDNNDTLPRNREMTLTSTSLSHGLSNEASVPQALGITRSQKATQERILYVTEHVDYDDEFDDNYEDGDDGVFTVPPHVSYEACPYDRCKHLQLPCDEIQKRSGGNCLCPGISGNSVPPDAPRLKQVIPGQSGIGVSWCSPLSTVQSYRVLYGTPEGPLEMGPLLNQSYRFFSITNLLSGTAYRVCVVAINNAGESQVEPGDGKDEELDLEDFVGPCGTFHTSHGSYMYLAIGGGLATLAVVLGVSVLIYWFRSKKKVRGIRRKGGDEMGVTNMSFKAESIENL